jgi:molybdate transport repressor ModE-like protein
MLELKQLRYLQAISESGSLTAAARALGVSQPTLTVAVRQLEVAFGTTLFLRDRSGVRLTRTGEVLRDYAHQVLDTVKRAEDTIVSLESAHTGHFVVGCHESLGGYLLPAFLPRFFQQEPKIGISLWTGSSAFTTTPKSTFRATTARVTSAELPVHRLMPIFGSCWKNLGRKAGSR